MIVAIAPSIANAKGDGPANANPQSCIKLSNVNPYEHDAEFVDGVQYVSYYREVTYDYDHNACSKNILADVVAPPNLPKTGYTEFTGKNILFYPGIGRTFRTVVKLPNGPTFPNDPKAPAVILQNVRWQ